MTVLDKGSVMCGFSTLKHFLNEQIKKQQRQSYGRHSFCPRIKAKAPTAESGACLGIQSMFFTSERVGNLGSYIYIVCLKQAHC